MALRRSRWQYFLESFNTTSGATALSQVAAEAALKEGGPWRHVFVEHLKSLIPYTADQLSKFTGVECSKPEGTFLLFPKVSAFDMDSESLADFILTEARVAVVPGAAQWFGSSVDDESIGNWMAMLL